MTGTRSGPVPSKLCVADCSASGRRQGAMQQGVHQKWRVKVSLHSTMAKARVEASTINHNAISALTKGRALQLARVSVRSTMAKARVEACTINHCATSACEKRQAWQRA